ncbi:MAG TPA: NAD(P)-dependent oxidoreductase [Xanthomonadaceae bacterium]|nr:NAD(P)-dependent oxidoreductase [Xanthomonadaceae bacterium]
MSELRVGVIGLGAMGAPMATHLMQRGMLRAVYNRTSSRAQAFAETHGVPAAGSIAELGHRCNAVLTCVSADADVLALARELKLYLAPGALVIDASTVAPATASEAAAILAQAGVAFLDAPVSGGVEGARNGTLSVMVGGDADTLARARPMLEAFASRITHMGKVGAGQATKAVNQVMVAGIAETVCEALALAEKLGLDPERLLPTLSAGAAQSWFLDKRGASMLRDEFSVGFKLALLHKDLGIVRQIGADLGAGLPIVEKALADYAALLAEGHGDDDISALIRLKRRQMRSR